MSLYHCFASDVKALYFEQRSCSVPYAYDMILFIDQTSLCDLVPRMASGVAAYRHACREGRCPLERAVWGFVGRRSPYLRE